MTVGGSGFVLFFNLFILIGGQSLHNTVVIPATHRHESVMGAHMSPCPEPLSHLPLHPIPLSCPRALALSALLHASNRFLGNRPWVQFWICEIWYAYIQVSSWIEVSGNPEGELWATDTNLGVKFKNLELKEITRVMSSETESGWKDWALG